MSKKIAKLEHVIPQQVNANAHTPAGMGLLEGAIARDGWIGAITVAADGETFDGSARREVLETAGLDDPIVVETDGRRPVVLVRTDIPSASDPRARRLAIEANQIAARNLAWDASILAEIAEQDATIRALWTAPDWARLLEQAGSEIISAGELWKGMPEFEQDDQESWKSIKVHFANEQDYQAFARLINQTLTQQTKYIWYPYKEKIRHLDYIANDES